MFFQLPLNSRSVDMKTFVAFCVLITASLGQRFPVINDGNDNTPVSHLEYIASLQLVTTEEEFFCGGVFISRKAVLTLASCFYQQDVLLKPEEVRIVAGSQYRLEKELNTFSGVLERIIVHENFSRSSLENRTFEFPQLIDEIPLNNIRAIDLEEISKEQPSEKTKCLIYGWSLTTRFGGAPFLLSGEVEIEKKDECDVVSNKVTSTTLCAGPYFVNGCETDDGSPLVCNGKLSGLIDFRPTDYCSKIIMNRLGTYVDVSQFRDWIGEYSVSHRTLCSLTTILLSSIILSLLC